MHQEFSINSKGDFQVMDHFSKVSRETIFFKVQNDSSNSFYRLDKGKTGFVKLDVIYKRIGFKRNIISDCITELLAIEHGIHTYYHFYFTQ
jgi:hypothetical protein